VRFDHNEILYKRVVEFSKIDNPRFYEDLIRRAKSFFIGVNHPEKVKELDSLIKNKLENRIGRNYKQVLQIQKNLPRLGSVTPNKNHFTDSISKGEILVILEEIEDWIELNVVKLADCVRFSSPVKAVN